MLRVGGGRGIFARAATAPAGGGAYTPLSLFAAGEKGGWYDVSDLSSMFQDAAGTTPVTATTQPVGRLEDKSGNGNHITAAGTLRPTLQQDGNGFYYLAHDGVDDTLSTAGNMAVAGGKSTLWTGHDKEGGFVTWIAQFTIGASQEGSFAQYSYGGTLEASVKAGGTSTGAYATAGEGLLIATSKFDMVSNTTSEAANSMRLNGAAVTLSYNAQIPNGTFAAAPFFLGSQNGTSPFNGRMYSCIVRFAESTIEEIENTETWLNERMGAY